jgi:hypothetical protein
MIVRGWSLQIFLVRAETQRRGEGCAQRIILTAVVDKEVSVSKRLSRSGSLRPLRLCAKLNSDPAAQHKARVAERYRSKKRICSIDQSGADLRRVGQRILQQLPAYAI